MPLSLRRPLSIPLSADNPADSNNLLSGLSSANLLMGLLVLLIAVALLVWQMWGDRRGDQDHTPTDGDARRSPDQDTDQ